MQATVRTTGSGIDRLKFALAATGVLVATITGTAAVTQLADSRDAAPAQITAPTSIVAQQPAWRLAEINQLPTAHVERFDVAQARFLEINTLPERTVPTMTWAEMRFLEINQVPEDALVAPEVVRGSRS